MSTPNQLSDTPRTDAAWAKTFLDDDDQCRAGNAASDMRDACATLERELTANTAERDQLRADCENETKWAAHYLAESIAVKGERDQLRAVFPQICAAIGNGAFCTPTVSLGFIQSIPNEVQLVLAELRARAMKAEAAETVALSKWNGVLERALKAEADLAALAQCHDDNCRALVKIAAELAAERARLDSGQIMLIVAGERVWHSGVDLRAAIDAKMKEDAK